MTAPPIPNGSVLVDSHGRLAALGPDASVPSPPGAEQALYPDAALLPGLVNAHTHLELTGLRGRVPEPDFFQWIQHIRRAKDETPEAVYLEWAREGVRETWRYGTTTVADTGTSGAVVQALTELGGAGVVYHEAIHPDPGRAEATFDAVRDTVARLRREAGPRVALGVSPHAPYTVSRMLYRRVAEYARAEGLPLAGHIAESRAELEFVSAGQGPFAEAWRTRSIPLGPQAASPIRLLEALGVLGPDFLAIHAVQVDEQDLAALERAGSAVVTCPRSNARHGHGAPPVSRYLERGLRLALGTDSAASVDTLDLLAEAREARWLGGLSAEEALRLATLGGATALGLDREIGSLEPGKWADFVVVRLGRPPAGPPDLAAEAILLARPEDIVATFVSGRHVYQAQSGGASPA
ncbi:MAG TPA: amidohydrolase family protein [Gemmatimonadales bacterium]|nr:amidohydrolase family protein [Gemmatimonadales bacterium]